MDNAPAWLFPYETRFHTDRECRFIKQDKLLETTIGNALDCHFNPCFCAIETIQSNRL